MSKGVSRTLYVSLKKNCFEMDEQSRKKAFISLQMARQQGEITSTSPNVNRKIKIGSCASSSSSVFRKCLNESGYKNPFDTIHEVEEESTEVKCQNGSKNAEKYEVKEKKTLDVSPAAYNLNSVAFPVSNKKRIFTSQNSSTADALSVQLESLLKKTDYLKDAMNKKRTTIQKSLECKAKLTCKLSTNKLNRNGLSTINEATPQLHPATDVSLRNPTKTKEPATQSSLGHQMKSDNLNMSIDSSNGGRNRKISWPKKGNSQITKVSLPNIKLESILDKDNEIKQEKDIVSKPENSHAVAAKGESTPHIESKQDAIRAWRKKSDEDLPSSSKDDSNAHLKLKKARSYTYPRSPKAFHTIKQSKQSDEKRTENGDLEKAKNTLTVALSNNTYLRSRSKSTYKMTAGKIFKIRDMLNIDINEGLSTRGREVTGDNWNSIKHCRYLRNMIEPEFCTCNMCERCRKDTR